MPRSIAVANVWLKLMNYKLYGSRANTSATSSRYKICCAPACVICNYYSSKVAPVYLRKSFSGHGLVLFQLRRAMA